MNPRFLAIALPLFTIHSLSAELDRPIDEKSKEFVINLKNPEYSQGVIRTECGGVITAPCLRIQAQNISYTDTSEVQRIAASGDILLDYHGQIFVGEQLEYDLRTKTGFLIGGKTKVEPWYIGGDRIDLECDGSFAITGVYLTTSAGQQHTWEIRARSATITEGNILTARDVRFKVLNVPLLWLPAYKSNLKKFIDPPIRFRILWDKGLGPRFSARYRFFSNETLNIFARLDCRFTLSSETHGKLQIGPGGSLEADFLSKDKLTQFQSRNYAAYDKSFPDENGWRRFRFQGIYKVLSEDQYTRFHVQWDRLSDDRMVGDFADPDFEINTQKTTYLELSQYKYYTYAGLSVRPRINPFDTLNQELPYGVLGVRPLALAKTGVILENYANGAYLDYTFANQLDKELKNRKSGRLETKNSLYRPFTFNGINFTPNAGVVGIYYSQSPERSAAGQFLFTYGADLNTRYSKQYPTVKHTVEPYLRFLGYSKPKVIVDDYFVFDIHDGYDKLNQMRFGLRQLFFSKEKAIFLPVLTLDLYSYAFWGAKSFDQTVPKAFFDLKIEQSSYALRGGVGWNIQEGVLDYGNVQLLWTVNAAVAFGLEYLHRSKFWWRKADHDNFVVDFARPIDQLLTSPLSDGRNTFLAKAHFRLSPRWNMQLQAHHGWGRSDEPSYTGAKVDFYTMLTGNWQMKLTYEYMPNDPYRFSYSFKLIK